MEQFVVVCLLPWLMKSLTSFLCVRHEVSSFTETIHPPSVLLHTCLCLCTSLHTFRFSPVAVSILRSPRVTKKKEKKRKQHHVFSFLHDSIRPLSPVGFFSYRPVTLSIPSIPSIPRTAASSSSLSSTTTTTTNPFLAQPSPPCLNRSQF